MAWRNLFLVYVILLKEIQTPKYKLFKNESDAHCIYDNSGYYGK